MIRFYSIFISDDGLLASPYVQRLNVFYDLTIRLGKAETVNFLLQTPLTKNQQDNVRVICDPLTINIHEVKVKSYIHQSIVSVDLTAKEVGATKIGIAFPQSTPLFREQIQSLPTSLVSVSSKLVRNKTAKINCRTTV